MKVALQQVVQRHAFADQQHRVLLDYLQAIFALSLCEHDCECQLAGVLDEVLHAFVRNIFSMTETDQRIGFGLPWVMPLHSMQALS